MLCETDCVTFACERLGDGRGRSAKGDLWCVVFRCILCFGLRFSKTILTKKISKILKVFVRLYWFCEILKVLFKDFYNQDSQHRILMDF
jgi:hypothetical protein